jgi:hypothetical protein
MSRLATLAAGSFLVGALVAVPIAGAAQQTVAVVVNGQQMSFDQPPIVQAGRVFVPLRSIFQQLGASVVYANGQINATGRGRTVALTIGSTQATVSGQPVTLDVAPFVVGSRTLVPLRFVAQSLGASVNWNDANSTVTIDGGNKPGYRVSNANVNRNDNINYISEAPPQLPEYQQPYAPAPNYIWTPGYWAWSGSGYYWVPGTWAQAPQTGLYWTPGYWGENANGPGFAWNPGYWAPQVGFYGGINYGFGYFGNGYQGGRWGPNGFAYNTAVSNVNRTTITNTYVDRTVVRTTVINRVSYNGRGGVQIRPTQQQLAVAKDRHVAMTPEQTKHVQAASQDRNLYNNVNHGKPTVPAVTKPLGAPPVVEKPAAPPVAPKPAAPQERPAPQPRETVRPENRATVTPEVVKPPVRAPKATPVPEPRATVKPEVKPPAQTEPKPQKKPETKPTDKPSPPPYR